MFIQKIFKKPQTKTTVPMPTATAVPAVDRMRTSETRKIFLNAAAEEQDQDTSSVTVLGAASTRKAIAPVAQKLKNGNTMTFQPDGSYIVCNAEGDIIKTCDVMCVIREFDRDKESGELMVRRFGVWTKPACARLERDGTLFFINGALEVQERLNGLHIHRNNETGVIIQTHTHNNFELIKMPGGEVWKRQHSPEKESFVIWQSGKLTFKSETLFTPSRQSIQTPAGPQPLIYVSRAEQSWSNGQLVREKFGFKNMASKRKEVNLTIQLSSGMLLLKDVACVTTTYKDGIPSETSYELKEPVKLKLDVTGKKCQLDQVIRVRNFAVGANSAMAFDTSCGNEYIVFVGASDRKTKSATEYAEMDELPEEDRYDTNLIVR